MKKLLTLILLVTILLTATGAAGTYALAAEIDLTLMSLENLAILQQRVEGEMRIRSVSLLPQGVYIVGKDIQEGTYILTSVDKFGANIYANEDDFKKLNWTRVFVIDKDEMYRIYLEEGMVVQTLWSTCIIQEVPRIIFEP